MTRNQQPIANARIRGAKSSGIQFSIEFEGWEAAIAAGATIEELYKWYGGEYPRKFMAHVIQWHRSHKLVRAHEQDAVRPKGKKGK